MTPEAARAILQLGYPETDHARMAELARKSNEGELTADERDELKGYVLVGEVLAMMKAKAHLSLRAHNSAG
jgi:hypothetical protein